MTMEAAILVLDPQIFQWQDGKKVIVWPEELAALKARFPTPPWSQRP